MIDTTSESPASATGMDQGSKPLNFTVGSATSPVITAVADSDGTPVENGGQTYLVDLTLEGTAPAGKEVEILVDDVPGATATATDGHWTLPVKGLSSGQRELVAQGKYGKQPKSEVWKVNIIDKPALEIDPTTMRLETDGDMFVFYSGTELVRPGEAPSGSFEARHATGGEPPLAYRSSAPEIARVDADTGLVESLGNGTATITVEDSLGQTASYDVVVSKVIQFVLLPEGTFTEGRELRFDHSTYPQYALVHDKMGRSRLESLGLLQRYWAAWEHNGRGIAADFTKDPIEFPYLNFSTRLRALGPRKPNA